MKLIHHTISKLSIVMIIILTFWAGFFFYSILDEILDETDDSLENYKHLIIQQVQRDTAAINNSSDLMSQYFIKEISENEAIHYKERYFDYASSPPRRLYTKDFYGHHRQLPL